MLEKIFKLKENNTDVRTEVMAGITSFMTMAYILAVNPSILSACGMDAGGVLVATALASFIGTVCMALMANYPFVLAPGMGLNAYFAYTVCLSYGYDWRIALAAVAVEGIIFIVLSLTNVREALFNAIPLSLKQGVSAGIGLFIAFIGLQNAELVVGSSATLVTYQSFAANIHTSGICAILALVGVLIIAILYLKKVKGAILYGIFLSWILGILCQLVGIYVPDAEAGYYSLIPNFSSWEIGNIGAVFGQVFKADFSNIDILTFVGIIFSFLFVDMFDTLGTLIGVASKSDMLDEDGKLPRIKPALLADAVATTAGAVLGTSTTTTFVESASGVAEGGRTGLTAMTSAVLFLLAIVLSPIFVSIPSYATAPALIFVGFLMVSSILKINFDDLSEAIPAYLCMIGMPLFYSISEGIAIGIISYVIINLCGGNKKKVSPLMIVLALIFVCKYIFL
ncbi:MAG: NCS2 family permease [Lachnospiraceae bacterium]